MDERKQDEWREAYKVASMITGGRSPDTVAMAIGMMGLETLERLSIKVTSQPQVKAPWKVPKR